MTEIPLLREIAVIAAVSVVVTVVLGRLRLPVMAGLLFSGAVVGPHGLALVDDVHAIEVFAEVGVVLLLFTIGLEFSLKQLEHIFRRVALGGVLQVGGTILVVMLLARALDVPTNTAIFYGFVVALSSTAIVLRALARRNELDAPHGRFIVGTLIFQDLCVVPMVLAVPMLGSGDASVVPLLVALGKAAAVVIGVLFLSRLVVPRLFGWVDASKSREVFLLAVVAICIGTAWVTSLAGLSLALGAFLGGMVVADTEYRHRAMGDILPLRDVFVSFFFVSLGMFFDGPGLVEHAALVGLLLAGFILGKGFLATLAALVMRFPVRAAWLAGVGLAQFGEFGFVLLRLGADAGLVDAAVVGPVLNAGIISMFLTPVIVHLAPRITAGERLLTPLARLLRVRSIEEDDTPGHRLEQHVVIVGYGLAGRALTASLARLSRPHLVLELSAENVRKGREAGDEVYYADATSEEALGHAHLAEARALVVSISDPQATLRVVDMARRVAPAVPIFVRTRYLADRVGLESLGASDVTADEVEGGAELLARVLRELGIARNDIEAEIHELRLGTQPTARALSIPRGSLASHPALAAMKVETVRVMAGGEAAGSTLRALALRGRTGALAVATLRGGDLHGSSPDEVLEPGDLVYLVGSTEAIAAATRLFTPTRDDAIAHV